jgi:hypothetical protein
MRTNKPVKLIQTNDLKGFIMSKLIQFLHFSDFWYFMRPSNTVLADYFECELTWNTANA